MKQIFLITIFLIQLQNIVYAQSPQEEWALEVSMYSDAFPTSQKCKIYPAQYNNCTEPASQCEVWGCVNSPFYVSYIHPAGDFYVEVNAINGNPDTWNNQGQFFDNPFYYDANYPSYYANTPAPHHDIYFFEYATPGVYTIFYTLYNQNNQCLAYIEYTIHVIGGTITDPLINIQPNPVCYDDVVNISTGLNPNLHTFYWTVTDPNSNIIATNTNQSFNLSGNSISTTGTYTVSFQIDRQCGDAAYTQTFDVVDLLADFTYTQHNCNQFNFSSQLTCSVAGVGYTYHWEIDNPVTGTNPDYQHTSTNSTWNNVTLPAGIYNVILTVTPNNAGAQYTTPVTVLNVVTQPDAPIVAPNPLLVCGLGYGTLSGYPLGENFHWDAASGDVGISSIVNYPPGCVATLLSGAASGVVNVYYVNSLGCTSAVTPVQVFDCCDGAIVQSQSLTFNSADATYFLNYMYSIYGATYVNLGTRTISNVNQKIAFNGTFEIDNDLSFIGCNNVTFGPYAEVVLDPSTTLNINNSRLYSCDGINMWKGIYATDPSTNVLVSNGSIIRDAIAAIHSIGGGNVESSSSFFRDNYVGIEIINGDNVLRVYGTTFEKYSGLLLPYASTALPHAGITLDKSINIGIGGDPNTFTQNLFQKSESGIIGINSSAYIGNNRFTNMWSPALGYGICFTNVIDMQTLDIGYDIQGLAAPNEFDAMKSGVKVEGQHLLRIFDNDFTAIRKDGITVVNDVKSTVIKINQNYFYHVRGSSIGTALNFGSDVSIYDNIMDLYVSGTPNLFRGINIFEFDWTGTQTPANYRITNNHIDNAFNGIFCAGTAYALIDHNIIRLYPATMNNLKPEIFGIRMLWSVESLIRYNTIDGNITGGPFFEKGIYGIDLQYSPSPLLICDSVIDCNWGIAARGSCYPAEYITNGLKNDSVGFAFYDNGYAGPQGFAAGNFVYTFDNRWTGTFPAHTKTYDFTDGTNIPFYLKPTSFSALLHPASFIAGNANTGIDGTYLPVVANAVYSSYMSCGSAPPAINYRMMEKLVQDSISFSGDTTSMKLWNKENIISFLMANPSYRDSSAVLQHFYDSCSIKPYSKILMTLDSIKNKDTSLVQHFYDELMEADAENWHDQNLKTLVLIINETYGNGLFKPDSIYLDTVRAIASLCPSVGGPAVFIARGLYAILIDSVDVTFDENCIVSTGYVRLENEEKESLAFALRPTLIGDEKQIQIITTESGSLLIYDLTGRIMLEEKLNAGSALLHFDEAPGFYFYKFTSNNHITNSGKLVIAK